MRNRHPVPMPVVLGSPLEQARAAFDSLTHGPNPVSVDGRAVPDMPPRPVRLDEVRNRLRERGCPAATRDAIWAFLVHRARTEAGVWTIACLGCALPVLVQASRRLCRSLPDLPPLCGPALRCARARSAVTGVPHHLPGTPTPTGAGTGSGPGTGTGGAPPPAGMRGDAPWGRVDRAPVSGLGGRGIGCRRCRGGGVDGVPRRARGRRSGPPARVGAAAVGRARGRGTGPPRDHGRPDPAGAAVRLLCPRGRRSTRIWCSPTRSPPGRSPAARPR